MRNVGILTLKLHHNYGGVLQCWALITILRKLGYNPIVFHVVPFPPKTIRSRIASILRYFHLIDKERSRKDKNIASFIKRYIPYTYKIDSRIRIQNVCSKYKLDAVVVGSDQVWRKVFVEEYGNSYFLDFVPDNVCKFSYAASFGTSTWDYDTNQTMMIKQCLSLFRGISVREYDAIELCKNELNIDAKLVCDPTLLLSSVEYTALIGPTPINSKFCFVYWLGEKTELDSVLLNLKNNYDNIVVVYLQENRELESVEQWLSYIKYADYVITDSFHGCAFSIIFNKQFKVYPNAKGGFGRITTLFRQLNIEYKLKDSNAHINYDIVNHKVKECKISSLDFINQMLG